MYSVIITSRAERELRRLDRAIKNRVTTALLALANDPRPHGCLKVKADQNFGVFVSVIGALAMKLMILAGK